MERGERRAVGVTVDGLPVELVVAEPGRLRHRARARDGLACVRRGARAAPGGSGRGGRLRRARHPLVPAGAARGAVPRRAAAARRARTDPRRPAHALDVVGREGERARDGRGARSSSATSTWRSATTRGTCAWCRGSTRRTCAGRPRRSPRPNELLAPFRLLHGIECDILDDGSLDLPDDVLAGLDWVMASVHAGQRMPRDEMTKRVLTAMEHPAVSALSHPTGRLINQRLPNAVDLEQVVEAAVRTGVALEVNGLPPRLDLKDEHVRLAVEAGARHRLLDRRPLRARAREHAARGRNGAARLGAAGARGQHAAAGRDSGAPTDVGQAPVPGPVVDHSPTSYQCVSRRARATDGSVCAAKKTWRSRSQQISASFASTPSRRIERLVRQLRLGDRVVLELQVGRELEQLGPVGTRPRAHAPTPRVASPASDQRPSSRTIPRSTPRTE